MIPRCLSRVLPALLLAATLATPSAAQAAPADDGWSFRLAPYLWSAGIDGEVTNGLGTAEVEVEFEDIWNNLDSAALLYFEAQRGRLSLVSDLVYISIEVDGETPVGNDADLETDTLLLDFAGLYRVAEDSNLEVGLGARYAEFDNELTIGLGSGGREREALDGFGAVRGTWPIAERWYVQAYGDVGAGDSDLTWQASALVGYEISTWGLGLGYRMLDYDFEEGNEELDLTFSGLFLGVEFHF